MTVLKRMLFFFASFLIAVLAIGSCESLFYLLRDAEFLSKGQNKYFLMGFALYFPLHLVFRKFIIIHIFGHELTHAIWAVLFGARIKEIYASESQGGFTVYTRENFMVLLAPYFFPLYAIVFTLLYHVSKSPYDKIFLLFIGFSTAFHIVLTLWSIKLGQSDIKRVGVIFSLCFILLMNVLILGMIICTVQEGCSMLDFVEQSLDTLPRNLNVIKNVLWSR